MRRFQVSTVLMLGTLAMFLTGCSRNPVSPEFSNRSPEAAVGVQSDDVPGELAGGTPTTLSASFLANEGGRLTVGRFTLDLHKNSLRMPATITLHVADENSMEVSIEVVPAEANDLKVHAEITANLSDQPQTNWDAVTMFGWGSSDWVQFEDYTAQVGKENVVGKMQHLGVVRVGDAENVGEEPRGKK